MHLLTSERLKYMYLTNKEQAKSKPVTWNGNSVHNRYSGNDGVGDGCNTFPWTFLHFTDGLMIFRTVLRPLMIQYFNGNSVNVDSIPAWQTLSNVYNQPRHQRNFKKIALAPHHYAGSFNLIWFINCKK